MSSPRASHGDSDILHRVCCISYIFELKNIRKLWAQRRDLRARTRGIASSGLAHSKPSSQKRGDFGKKGKRRGPGTKPRLMTSPLPFAVANAYTRPAHCQGLSSKISLLQGGPSPLIIHPLLCLSGCTSASRHIPSDPPLPQALESRHDTRRH